LSADELSCLETHSAQTISASCARWAQKFCGVFRLGHTFLGDNLQKKRQFKSTGWFTLQIELNLKPAVVVAGAGPNFWARPVAGAKPKFLKNARKPLHSNEIRDFAILLSVNNTCFLNAATQVYSNFNAQPFVGDYIFNSQVLLMITSIQSV